MDAIISPYGSQHSTRMSLYFRTLSFAAVILLWGSSVLNGSVKGLLVSAWTGQLDNGTALKTRYTGFPFLDYPIAVLVAFFFPGTSGQDEAYQLFVVDAFSAFAVAFVWLQVEASRPGQKPSWITRPVVFGILWELFGAAIVLPIYFAIHLKWAGERTLPQVTNVSRAMALTPTFLLGVVAPTAIVMAPTWTGQERRSAEAHQTILALFMLSPFLVYAIMITATHASAWLWSSSSTRTQKDGATWWVKAVHLQTLLVSAAAHLYVAGKVLTTEKPGVVNLTRMYLPLPATGPVGVTDVITMGSWLFLQYDHIIISLSSLSWAFLLLEKTPLGGLFGRVKLILAFLVGSVVIGPGASVSLALYLREDGLGKDYKD